MNYTRQSAKEVEAGKEEIIVIDRPSTAVYLKKYIFRIEGSNNCSIALFVNGIAKEILYFEDEYLDSNIEIAKNQNVEIRITNAGTEKIIIFFRALFEEQTSSNVG